MKMVVHQTEVEALEVVFGDDLREHEHEQATVAVVQEDLHLARAPRHYVAQESGLLDPRRSRHEPRTYTNRSSGKSTENRRNPASYLRKYAIASMAAARVTGQELQKGVRPGSDPFCGGRRAAGGYEPLFFSTLSRSRKLTPV